MEIENGRYTLKRGETWVAKIVHRGSANDTRIVVDPTLNDYVHPVLHEPTYEDLAGRRVVT